MEPDYETFECRFKFGKMPLDQADDDDVFRTLCFSQCPSKGRLRTGHSRAARMVATGEEAMGRSSGCSTSSRAAAAADAQSDSVSRELACAILQDSEYNAAIPPPEVYLRKLSDWLRGQESPAP